MTEFKKIFLDTAPLIYFLDNDANYAKKVKGIFAEALKKDILLISSVIQHFKGMDSLQLAVACLSGCDGFLTNDKQLKQFREVKCITIDDWELA